MTCSGAKATECLTCKPGFNLKTTGSDKTCEKIACAANSNCGLCSGDKVADCLKCADGFFQKADKSCTACATGCKTCTDATAATCSACMTAYF